MASVEQIQNGSLVTHDLENPQVKPKEADAGSVKIVPKVSIEKPKWPGWPGSCVFRLIVPVLKVGSIIWCKGELVKKMCEETGAKICVLDGPPSSRDRVAAYIGIADHFHDALFVPLDRPFTCMFTAHSVLLSVQSLFVDQFGESPI
uniref:Poly(RC)-binding protein n=1 Tax=Solanum tuberosum TaxID=4113 RepID=M1B771_SOLTU